MKKRSTPLPGMLLLEDERIEDERGFFTRSYDRDDYERNGLVSDFPQHSLSHNLLMGTLRGMHFQRHPHAEVKVVRCVRGAIFDVAVDLRRDSPSYGKWHGVELSAQSGNSVYLGLGLAHGFQTLTDDATVSYLISTPYTPSAAAGLRYDDADVGIRWPLPASSMSTRDRALPTLRSLVDLP